MQWSLHILPNDGPSSQGPLEPDWGALNLRAVRFLPGDDIFDWQWPDGPGPVFRGSWKWTWMKPSLSYAITLLAGNPAGAPYATLTSSDWRFPVNDDEPMEPWFSDRIAAGLGQLAPSVQAGRRFTWLWGDAPDTDTLQTFLFRGDNYRYNRNNVDLLVAAAKQEMFGPNAIKYIPPPRQGLDAFPVPMFARVTGLWSELRVESVAQKFADQLAGDLVEGGIDKGRVVKRILSRNSFSKRNLDNVDVIVDLQFPKASYPSTWWTMPEADKIKQQRTDPTRAALESYGNWVKSMGGLLSKPVLDFKLQADVKPALDMLGSSLQGKGPAGGDPPDKDYEDAIRKQGKPALSGADLTDDN